MDNLPVPQHRKVAVAARDAEKAKEFSQAHKFEKSYGSYKQLAEDEDVEIVYVSSLHPQHFELAKVSIFDHLFRFPLSSRIFFYPGRYKKKF